MNSLSVKIGAAYRSFDRTKALTLSAVTLVFAFGLLFRAMDLGSIPGINGDEAVVPVTIHEASIGKPVVLRMPTGRMFSPLYAGFAFVVNQIFPHSLAALRFPALFAGVLLTLLTYFLFAKVFEKSTALLMALLVASSSVNIAYSRSGVEQSFTGLFGILISFAALKNKMGWAALLMAMAVVMHPTNIFILPVVACVFGVHLFFNSKLSKKTKQQLVVGGVLVLVALSAILYATVPVHLVELVAPSAILFRLLDLPAIAAFYVKWLGIVSGSTAIEQFVAPVPKVYQIVLHSLLGISLPTLLFFGGRSLWRQKSYIEMAFILGTGLILASFYLVTGNWAMEPGVLRYSLVLLNPTLLSIALLLSAIHFKKPVFIGTLIVSFLFLLQFALFFFREIQVSNSQAHFTYQTGETEPKLVAFTRALSVSPSRRTLLIEDWWTYWPIRYLGLSQEKLDIQLVTGKDPLLELRKVLSEGGIVLGPVGGQFENKLRQLSFENASLQTSQIEGYGQKPVLRMWLLLKTRS